MKVLLLHHEDVRRITAWEQHEISEQAAARYSQGISKVIEWIRAVPGALPDGHEVVASMIPSHSDSAGRDPAVHFTVVKAEPRTAVPLFSILWAEFWGRPEEAYWKAEVLRLIGATVTRLAESRSCDRLLMQALRNQMGAAVG